VRCEAAVHGYHAFFFPDQLETLDKAGVFEVPVLGRCLTETCAYDLRAQLACYLEH
jgi:hypothetical protein